MIPRNAKDYDRTWLKEDDRKEVYRFFKTLNRMGLFKYFVPKQWSNPAFRAYIRRYGV